MRKNFLSLVSWIALLGVTAGCTSVADGSGPLQIRIANRSGYDFEKVTASFPSDKVDYGRVENGAVSDYREVKAAYRYALVEVATGGRSITFQPQDYMGEELLGPGRYTYALRLDDSGNNLQIELVTD